MRYVLTVTILATALGATAAFAQSPASSGSATNAPNNGMTSSSTGKESSGNADNSMVGTTANGTRPGTKKDANMTAVGADDTGPGGASDTKAKSTVHHKKATAAPSGGNGTSSEGTSK